MPDVTFYPTKDAYIIDTAPDTNCGTETVLNVFYAPDDIYRSFIQFDLSSISVSAICVTAALGCNVQNFFGAGTMNVNEPTATWYEVLVTWNNQPAVGAVVDTYAFPGATGYATILSDADFIALCDKWIANSLLNYGMRFSCSNEALSSGVSFYSKDTFLTKPFLAIHYNRVPNTPDQLSPSGGGSVSTLIPTISARFIDPDSEDTCDKVQIIIYESDGVTLKYDTGQVTPDTSPIDNGSTVSYTVPSAANLIWGQTYKYKIRVRDFHNASNSWSPYSALESFKCENSPTVTIMSPSDGSTVYTTEPEIIWEYYQAQGALQSDYRVRIATSTDFTNDTIYDYTASDWGIVIIQLYPWVIPYALGSCGDHNHQCPMGALIDEGVYYVRVDIVNSNGATAYDESITGFTYSKTIAPTDLVLTLDEENARVLIEWQYASPDATAYYEIYSRIYLSDDYWELIATINDDEAVSIYDYTCAKGIVEYTVIYVDEDGYKSNPDDCKGHITVEFKHWWLCSNDDTAKQLQLIGVSDAPYAEIDSKGVFYPLGRKAALVETSDVVKGIDMKLSLTFREEEGMTVREYLDQLRSIRDYDGNVFLKSNVGDRWKISLTEVNMSLQESIINYYVVSCRIVEV